MIGRGRNAAAIAALFALTFGVGCEEGVRVAEERAAKADYFVAANGNDAWSGRPAAPNAERTDGPFATISAARDAIRKAEKKGPVTILIRGGVYRLTEPIRFGPEDSGTEQCPITYAAYPDERPVISGGREITGWKKHSDKIWVAEIPEAKDGKWIFRRLYVNGYRRTLARTPNEGEFYRIKGKAAPMKDPKTGKEIDSSKIAFRFNRGDIKNWPKLNEIDAVVFYHWETAMLPLSSLDEETSTVVFTGEMKWPFQQNWRYYLENFFEAVDVPGEWHLDRTAGKLYYYAMAGEDMQKASVVAPVVTQFLVIDGAPKEKTFVDHLKFQGLSFQHSDYALEPTGHSDWQAAVTIPAAVQANGARFCSFDKCEIAHVGNYAIWFELGCTDNHIVESEIHDLGAGGVRIGVTGVRKDESEQTGRNVVSNNFIHDGGSVYYGGHPLWVGQSSDNVISHNEICDFNYSGISVGWSWGYSPTTCHRNVIEYNHLHHLGRGVLCDMAAIYTLGISTGTKIRNNHIHHIWDWVEGYGAGGIYPDEGSTGILIENNVVYCTTAGGFTVHYGRDNIARNNIFAFGRDAQVHLGRSDKESSLTFERNIVYYEQGDLLRRKSTLVADYNVYFNAGGPVTFLDGLDLKGWQAQGYDVHSVVADPLFVDAKRFDFRLKTDSPALKMGFTPIDISKAGLIGDAEWVNRPKRIKRPPMAIPPKYEPPPMTISDNFEESMVGGTADLAHTHGETKEATIRVTDEVAAGGKRCLKFTDAAGLDQTWNPHIYYMPGLKEGLARESFDLRLEKGAIVSHEWRTPGHPYIVGPNMVIHADGRLEASGQPVMTLPMGQWIRVEIVAGLGKQANGKYDLTVAIPGQPPRRMEQLTCDPKFDRIGWVGFVSNATERTVFFLDNVRLEITKP